MRVGILLVILIFVIQSFAGEFDYNLPQNQKVIAVGDIHGDIDALTKILFGMKLINADGKWIGNKSHLVLMGDLINKGDYSREVMDLVMRLEGEAERAGGKVHALLANYELLATRGIDRNLTYDDLESYQTFARADDRSPLAAYKRAFRGQTKYARWFRSRPAMVKINDTLFVHGSITEKMLSTNIDQMNANVQAWFKYYQGVGASPDRSTQWVVGNEGPLWSRAIEADSYELELADLKKILKHFGVNRLVVGHTVVSSIYETLYHPEFDGRVFMTETGNSYAMGGKISVLMLKDGYAHSFKIKRHSGDVVFKRKRKLNCSDLLKGI